MMDNKDKRLPTLTAVVTDFSASPFRLLFLTACYLGILAALVWALAAKQIITTNPLSLHVFLFLQSFAGAAFSGFLLTAIPEWMHYTGKLHRITQSLFCIVLVASIAAFFSLALALTLMLFLWFILAAKVSQIIYQKRDSRHNSVVFWLFIYISLTVYVAFNAWQYGFVSTFLWEQMLHVAVLGIALISFRIAKALGEQALKDARENNALFIPNPFYKNLSVWLFYLLVLGNSVFQDSVTSGWLSLAVAVVMLGRLREWHFAVLLKAHYVRWLYTTLLLIGIGYGWRGVALITTQNQGLLNPLLPLHLIAIGGFLLMCYQVFNIAGLRHSNLPLVFPKYSRLAMLFLLLAALSRSLLSGISIVPYTYSAIYLPGILCVFSFLFYLPIFYCLFCQNPATFPSEK